MSVDWVMAILMTNWWKEGPLPSVSTAILLAVAIGVFEALTMYLGSGLFLSMMGILPVSSMRVPAEQFLKLRAIGAPAVVAYLAIQGIFRGFKDTDSCLMPRYIVTFLMIWSLHKRTVLPLPNIKSLHFGGYLKFGLLSVDEIQDPRPASRSPSQSTI